VTLLAGSTRLHRLHRHASEPSGKKRSINVSLVHMCLPFKGSNYRSQRSSPLCGVGAAETRPDICASILLLSI
jgi:hypothetical protein